MTLAPDEFIRRFLQHTVPSGFHRIRHIGFLANCHRSEKLALCRKLLAAAPPQVIGGKIWWSAGGSLTKSSRLACRQETARDVMSVPGPGIGRDKSHHQIRIGTSSMAV